MEKAIKDMKTWERASTWLAKHGYGLGQIAEQKELWDADSKTPAAKVTKPEEPKTVTTKPAPTKDTTTKTV